VPCHKLPDRGFIKRRTIHGRDNINIPTLTEGFSANVYKGQQKKTIVMTPVDNFDNMGIMLRKTPGRGEDKGRAGEQGEQEKEMADGNDRGKR
jgi:hypothetical protein